ELNNPLTVVIGQAHLLREGEAGGSLVQRAQKIHTAADRCVRIVRNFLALARQHTPERREVRLNDVAREAVELLAYELRTGNVEEHGGTITVASAPGRGAKFRIELPVVAPPTAAVEPAAAVPPSAMTPKSILVVDDESEIAAVLAEMLQRAGHRVEIAANGAMGLEMLERRGYDLILTDTKMPVLDGVEFYRALERRFPQLCRRLIFVTGDLLDPEKRS